MVETIHSIFARLGQHTPIDAALLKRIHQYERSFVNRSRDHVEFFGGNLMGVNPIRFRTIDRDDWFAEVIMVDEIELREGISNLPSINVEWKRASDAMNLSCVWVLYAIYHSEHLTVPQKHEGMVNVLLILQYKFLASLMAHYYPYVADRGTMEAAYASLSKRYQLKVAGSWNRLLRQRAEEVVSPSGIHRKTYQSLTPDAAVIEMVNDIQGRLRKIVKALTEVFYDTKAAGGKIGVEKSVLNIDGQNVMKDKSRQFTSYIRYSHQVLGDVRSYIRKELVEIIVDLHHTTPPKQLEEALEWMCINHSARLDKWVPKAEGSYVEAFSNEVLLHAFSLITNGQAEFTNRSGLGPFLGQLRALYTASRMADPALLKAKDMANNIVNAAISSRNAAVAASVRTSIQLYVILRALTMEHYS